MVTASFIHPNPELPVVTSSWQGQGQGMSCLNFVPSESLFFGVLRPISGASILFPNTEEGSCEIR